MSDLRQVRTNREILMAFQKLLNKKIFSKITVNDIANEALIHRNTFYHHFTDKYELLKVLISKVLNKLLIRSQIQLFVQQPFTTIHNLYADHFEKLYEVQLDDPEFLDIIWQEFLRTIIKNSTSDRSFWAIGGFSAIMDWNNINNKPYDLFKDYRRLDHIFATHRFPKKR